MFPETLFTLNHVLNAPTMTEAHIAIQSHIWHTTFLNVATEDHHKQVFFFVIEQLFQTKSSNISHTYLLWKKTEDIICLSVL